MRAVESTLVGLALGLFVACGGDDGGDGEGGGSGPSTGAVTSPTTGGGTPSMMSDSATTASSMSAAATDTSAGSATTVTSTTDATAGSGTTTMPAADSSSGDPDTGSGVCGAVPDDACLQCAQQSCCRAFTACMADPTCECVLDCHVVDGGSLNSCINACNHAATTYQELFFCGQQSCLNTCDWDCC